MMRSGMRLTIVSVLSAVPASLVLGQSAGEARRPWRPNVVFILADDLGISDLHCYGRADHRTPRLDEMARRGRRFTQAYCAQPICSPSRAAIMTGKHPARLHLTTYLPGRPDAPSQKLLQPVIYGALPLEEKTLAEYLREVGYLCACFGKWHLGGKGYSPLEQGFAVYEPGQANTVPSPSEGGKGEFDLTRRALAFIEKHRDQPFFVYLCHNTPHIPLAAQAEKVAACRDAFNPVYAAMMHTLDETVGMLLDRLHMLGLAERTLVIFTSDNGGLHVLEGAQTPATHNRPFRGGKGFVYEGGLRIPLIVYWPQHVAYGVEQTPVVHQDWLPTLVELCCAGTGPDGLGLSRGSLQADGISLLPLLLEGHQLPPRTLYWHFPHYTNQGSRPAGAVRAGRWKLIENYEDQAVGLYDLESDPGEENNLASRYPDIAANLLAQLRAWRKAIAAQENRPNPDFRADWHQQLYVDMDVSRLPAARHADALAKQLTPWRRLMNQVIVGRKPVLK